MNLLKQIVSEGLTSWRDGFDTWEDAIYGCGIPMIEHGYVEKQYLDCIIKCINEYGPYIIIAPDVAMPHSTECCDGVFKTGICFMKTKNPVHFDENDETKDARLFFMLASEDHEKHLNNMMALCDVLMNEELVEDLKLAQCDEDLLRIGEKYHL